MATIQRMMTEQRQRRHSDYSIKDEAALVVDGLKLLNPDFAPIDMGVDTEKQLNIDIIFDYLTQRTADDVNEEEAFLEDIEKNGYDEEMFVYDQFGRNQYDIASDMTVFDTFAKDASVNCSEEITTCNTAALFRNSDVESGEFESSNKYDLVSGATVTPGPPQIVNNFLNVPLGSIYTPLALHNCAYNTVTPSCLIEHGEMEDVFELDVEQEINNMTP